MKTRGRGPRAGRAPWSSSAPTPGVRTVALLTDMTTPLGPDRRQRGRGRRVARGARRWRPGRRRRADPGAGPRDARRRRARRGVDPAHDAARRLGDGPLAGDDRGPGRRPRRRCRSVRTRETHDVRPGGGTMGDSTRWRWDWRPGGSAPAAPARRTRCRPAPACACTPTREPGARGGAAAHPAHRHPGAVRGGAARTGRRLERRRSPSPASSSSSAVALVIDRIVP